MDRDAALTYLQNEYVELVTEAKFTTDQVFNAYTTATDMSLRVLGVSETALATYDVPQGNILAYVALLNYHALKRIARLLSIRFDVTIPNALVALRSQAFKQVEQLLVDAQYECQKYGYDVGGINSGFQIGRLELDFLEPDYPFGIPFPYGGGDF